MVLNCIALLKSFLPCLKQFFPYLLGLGASCFLSQPYMFVTFFSQGLLVKRETFGSDLGRSRRSSRTE
jgi:hypothetical protein